uniref:Uncharacterized protein n=1 Tax=Timema genevievae TaxID=629358 RepID=A0A7R9KA15_TIMGE|nr:unnamed protein product [Timema genevievae]
MEGGGELTMTPLLDIVEPQRDQRSISFSCETDAINIVTTGAGGLVMMSQGLSSYPGAPRWRERYEITRLCMLLEINQMGLFDIVRRLSPVILKCFIDNR